MYNSTPLTVDDAASEADDLNVDAVVSTSWNVNVRTTIVAHSCAG